MENKIENRIKKDFDVSALTTFKVSLIARYYFYAESEQDLIDIINWANKNKIKLILIGGGSNILAAHTKIDAIVVKNGYIGKQIVKETDDYVLMKISSGYVVTRLAKETAEAGYSGLEWHFGLPGTVGGAIYMNSKWPKPTYYFGNDLISAIILTSDGRIKTVDKEYFDFSYGYSSLQKTKDKLISAVFKLKKDDPEILKSRLREVMDYRRKTQPQGQKTAGCFFKNGSDYFAGEVIDKKLGLKGYCIGDACVSEEHANFIINIGNATAEDIIKLKDLIKSQAKEKYNIELVEEVEII